ncbi:hypothetical protein N0V82_002815 [Gnomoniopsis sp. IMI 355080]|nr:hypothetical protein N0V82_002815 [Gnomoniopsis sp. IMI 355080]
MSRGPSGWLSCATAVALSQVLGFDTRYAKQLVFASLISLQAFPDYTKAELLQLILGYLRNAVIVFITFQVARWLLAPSNTSPWTGPGKVLLFPGLTTHTRLFPKKHSFDYSYLVVGIPVGWEGISGGMVSSSSKEQPWSSLSRRGWYHIDPEDYLDRGNRQMGLRGKLDAYLRSQGVDPSEYPHAYLVTAARFLGYHFNPASFWYLYADDMSLRGMIIEVNNTFDERRMYLLRPQKTAEAEIEGAEHRPVKNGPSSLDPPVFKQQWPKDFHVSPFNSRKGAYSLLAYDPLRALAEGRSPIDSTITLKSSKGHGKIVARLVSKGHAIDPSRMSFRQKAVFLSSWWWVGFITFPRIVREAARLWFQRKLHVWYRPEPLKESMGRNADSAERRLEVAFRSYLRSLVKQCHAAVAVKYIPSGIASVGEELMLSPSAKSKSEVEDLEFKVLTPVFYTRFVSYAHDLEALFSELRESCTIWVSRPELLPKLLFKGPAPALEARSPLDYLYFEAIRYLRRRPERIVRPLTSSQTYVESPATTYAVDIRDFRISSMDAFIQKQEDAKLRNMYRSLVIKLFVADRLGFGSLLFVDTALIMFETWLAWTVAFAFQGKMRVLGLVTAILAYGYE